MNIKKRLENKEYSVDDIVDWLNTSNPMILYSLITTIATNHMDDSAIIEKLHMISSKLSNNDKVLGYYKVGHLAMSVLLKLGRNEEYVFDTVLDPFEKEMTLKFFMENDW